MTPGVNAAKLGARPDRERHTVTKTAPARAPLMLITRLWPRRIDSEGP